MVFLLATQAENVSSILHISTAAVQAAGAILLVSN